MSIFPCKQAFHLKNVISSRGLLWRCWRSRRRGTAKCEGWLFLNDEQISQRHSKKTSCVSCLYANELCVKHGCCEGSSPWKSWLHGSINQRAFPIGSSILPQSATHKLYTLYKYYTHANSVHVQMHAEFIYMCVYHFMGFMFVFRSLFTSLSNSPAALKKTQQHQCGFNMQKTNLLIISKSSDIGSCIAIVHKKWLVHWVEQYLHL